SGRCAIRQARGTAERVSPITRLGAQFAIIRCASVSRAVVAVALDCLLVRTTWGCGKLARKSKWYRRHGAIFSFRGCAQSARNSGEPSRYLGVCVRFRTGGPKFRCYFEQSITPTAALSGIGQNTDTGAAVFDFHCSERGVQTVQGRCRTIKNNALLLRGSVRRQVSPSATRL